MKIRESTVTVTKEPNSGCFSYDSPHLFYAYKFKETLIKGEAVDQNRLNQRFLKFKKIPESS